MTKEEAINILNDYDINFERHTAEEIAEAHEMAIKAIRTIPSEDCISREAAIDYCRQLINVEHQQGSDEMNYGQERVNQTETILHHLEIMPSVQPSEDCISRKLMHDMGATCIAARNKDGDLVALGALNILPSATPQPKVGRWIATSERLPEKNVEVLATTEWGTITIAEKCGESCWLIYEGDATADTDEITAWMPLPKAYKESEDK